MHKIEEQTQQKITLTITDEITSIQTQLQSILSDNRIHFTWNENYIIGNFHPHRFELLREIEGLLGQTPSNLMQQLFGEKGAKNTYQFNLTNQQISPLDTDQLAVVQQFTSKNTVVEGPPGTGKSALLSNLSAQLMDGGYSTLIVSQKMTALNVIYQKLKSLGLHAFAHFSGEQDSTSLYLQHAQTTWKILENKSGNVPKCLSLSEQKRANLQGLLDKLNAQNLLSGCSYGEWVQLKKG